MPIKVDGFHNNKKVETNSNLIFLKNGTTQLRFLPAYSDKGIWCREIREIALTIDGKYSPQVSPSTFGKPCPFKAEGERLYKLGGEKNIAMAKALRPRSSFLFNVVVKSAPGVELDIEQCVKVLKCGKKIKTDLFDLDQDFNGGWGDITNIEKGFDIRITKTGQGVTDTKYITKGVPNRSNLLEWLEANHFTQELRPHDLDKMFEPAAYEELVVLLEDFKKQLEDGQPQIHTPGTDPFEGLDKPLETPMAPVETKMDVPKLV